MIVEARKLDEKGRCCGRKPISYKREPAHLFCPRCDAAFAPANGHQIANWAYRWHDAGKFESKTSRALPPQQCDGGNDVA